jgi:hypothetical protein
MVDEEFDVTLTGNDIKSSDKVIDLYGIIKSRVK